MDYFEIIHKLGFNIMCIAYRGYSASEGYPSEAGIKLDTLAIAQCALDNSDHINPKKLFLCGRSLGGAAALHLITQKAFKDTFKGLILENTFTSISEMTDKLFPFFKMIPDLKKKLLKMNWDSFSLIKKVKLPVLFVTGDKDEIVPSGMSQKLHIACQSPVKEIMVVEGGTHNDTWLKAGDSYGQRISQFISTCNDLSKKKN